MKTQNVTVQCEHGLHLRVATQVSRIAQQSGTSVHIQCAGCPRADACSVIQLLMLRASVGTPLEIEACSAGVEAHGVDPAAVAVMAEAGVDISSQRSKSLNVLPDLRFDCVVTLSERASSYFSDLSTPVPVVAVSCASPSRRAIGSRPALAHYRHVRDDIRDDVCTLLTKILRTSRRPADSFGLYAERLSREIPGSYYINQFANPANPLAQETGTGPELWAQMDHHVDAISVGVGSSGTLAGLTAFFKKANPALEFILADPKGSILADHVNTGTQSPAGSWLVEGIGEDFIPSIADFSRVKKGYSVTDGQSLETARTLLRKEGILAGSSTGVLVHAAIQYAREQTQPKNIVTFACDSGNKYLSKMFNDYWMTDHGLMGNPVKSCVADLISRYDSGPRDGPAGGGA